MASSTTIYTRYHSGSDFGGRLEVSKFRIEKTGIGAKFSKMCVEFEGEGDIKSAILYLEPKLAIPLARGLLSISDGYASTVELEIS